MRDEHSSIFFIPSKCSVEGKIFFLTNAKKYGLNKIYVNLSNLTLRKLDSKKILRKVWIIMLILYFTHNTLKKRIIKCYVGTKIFEIKFR